MSSHALYLAVCALFLLMPSTGKVYTIYCNYTVVSQSYVLLISNKQYFIYYSIHCLCGTYVHCIYSSSLVIISHVDYIYSACICKIYL